LTKHKFPYNWNLADGYPAKGIEPNNLNVFGTFICGGGSTMGYKLAGFNHLGGVEIDKKVAAVYKLNHNPKHLFIEDLRAFNQRNDLPDQLFELDILDGSPPCSTFSMAGNREKDWGKEKMFREGQAMQTLDDLVFVYTDTILKLRPKVAILENVKGLIQANARAYLHQIKNHLQLAGYSVQVFCLNAASMGVPQKRERVFLIARQTTFNWPDIQFRFFEKPILFGELSKLNPNGKFKEIIDSCKDLWKNAKQGCGLNTVHPNGSSFFSKRKVSDKEVCGTLTAHADEDFMHSTEFRCLNEDEFKFIGSYPKDYNFININPAYLIGMSVPPVMTAQIAHQIYLQWFKTEVENA
jgi:DNA (cytosine-5)-methyltransferase 1